MDNNIIYNTDDGATSVKLYANDGTVWLARAEIAALFQKDRSTISKHIKNIFAEGELDEKNNVHFLHIDIDKLLEDHGVPVLANRGGHSHDEMVRYVTDAYAKFDARRKKSDAQKADTDDLAELEREIPAIKHRKQ